MKIAVFRNGERGDCVIQALLTYGYIKVYGPEEDITSPAFWKEFASAKYDLAICAGYSKMITRSLLDLPKHGFWNCHAGPVPKYRGGSPLNWQIINNEEFIGITLMKMDEGLDTGPVISEAKFLRESMNIAEVHKKVNATFPSMVTAALKSLDTLQPKPQPESCEFVKQRTDKMGEIDLDWPAPKIKNFVDALCRPYPGAWVRLQDGTKLRIWDVSYDKSKE